VFGEKPDDSKRAKAKKEAKDIRKKKGKKR
jgi:hypothetical protein